ncbi:MFS transporter [Pseudomonas sp. Pseusp122]|uniref:MFS transporter n=1 Tax=unclassified Pseudomonas TaxID=196821 RepID=UPI0039A69369
MSRPSYAVVTGKSKTTASAWAMVAIGAGSILSSLDLFVVNLAFSAIHGSFPGATTQLMSWVLSAYSIAFAAFLVPSGRLADIYGRKRVFKAGLMLFAFASAACALAPDVFSLILARGLKGVGAALMIPTSLGLLLAAFPKERHKQMVGIWAATGSVAAALGPTLGGALVDINWRLIFLVNLPIAIIALALCKHLAHAPGSGGSFPDVFGSALLIAGIAFLVAGISYAPEWGLGSASLWATFALAAFFLAFFARRCMTAASPALDLSVFKAPAFTLATLGMAVFYMGFAIMLFGGTLYLTQVWRWNPMIAGAAFGVGPGTAMIASLVVGKTAVSPNRLTILAGLLFVAAGGWWYWKLTGEVDYFFAYLPGLMLSGAAAGIGQTGFLAGGAAALTPQLYATGTGIINTARQIGAAIGVAVFVAVTGDAVGFEQYHRAWLLMAGFGLLATLSAFVLRIKPEVVSR